MSEWKEYKLAELCELIGGCNPNASVSDYWNGDMPWLSVTDFNTCRKYCYEAEKSITEQRLKESSTPEFNYELAHNRQYTKNCSSRQQRK